MILWLIGAAVVIVLVTIGVGSVLLLAFEPKIRRQAINTFKEWLK